MKFQDILAAVLAAAAFLVLLAVFHWNFFVCLAIAVVLYFALSLLLAPRRKIGGVDVENLKNGEALEQTFDEAQKDLQTIEKAAQAASSPQIKKDARQLVSCGNSIITYLQTHVDKIPQARRFLNYYLDTAGDIMTRYVDFEKTNAPYSDQQQVTANTLQALSTLNHTFSSQYSRLLAGEVMNMEVDVEVLKKMAASDSGAPLSAAQKTSPDKPYGGSGT